MFNTLPKRQTILSNSCVICGLKTTFGCSQCKQVYYCSAEHQRQHWPIHSQTCNIQKTPEPKQLQEEQTLRTANQQKSKGDSFQALPIKSEKKLVEKQHNEKENLNDDHERYRQIAIRLISQKDYQDALIPLKKAIEVAQKIEQLGNKDDFYEKIADLTLLSRTYINLYDFDNARRILIQGYDQLKIFSKNATTKLDQNRISAILKVIAQLFYQTGDQRHCELAYVDYTTIIESSHGENSTSTGNAYFLVGVFYLQHKHYTQALACFKRALNIRMNINPNAEDVTDCWYNMGVIYKQCGKKEQAIEFLEKALKMRRQVIGDNSMQVATCLETLGKLYMVNGDLKSAYSRLSECFNIRKFLIKDSTHPEIERISKLIVVLYQKTQEQINGGQRNSRIQPQISQMFDKLTLAVNDNNLNKFIDVDVHESIDPFFLEQSSIQPEIMRRQRVKSQQSKTHIQNKKSEEIIKTDPDEKYINISAPVLESLSIDQLILLKNLQNDLKNNKNKQDQKTMIINCEFIGALSSIQFNLIKEQNQQIFGPIQEEQYSDQDESENSKYHIYIISSIGECIIIRGQPFKSQVTSRGQDEFKHERQNVISMIYILYSQIDLKTTQASQSRFFKMLSTKVNKQEPQDNLKVIEELKTSKNYNFEINIYEPSEPSVKDEDNQQILSGRMKTSASFSLGVSNHQLIRKKTFTLNKLPSPRVSEIYQYEMFIDDEGKQGESRIPSLMDVDQVSTTRREEQINTPKQIFVPPPPPPLPPRK